MGDRGERFLIELAKRVNDFVFDHSTHPNAIIISFEDLVILADINRSEIKNRLPTIICLIPTKDPFAFDLPLPVLLPVVATKLQRQQAVMLEGRNL